MERFKMTWHSEHFFWRPAKSKYDSSIHLYIKDGCRIRLDMDDCKAEEAYYNCECEEKYNHKCGHEDTALAKLSIQELEELHKAIGEAIKYYYGVETKTK